MSFHKKYIRKESILLNINDLDRLFYSETIVMDSWSTRFFDNLNSEDKILRKTILEKYEHEMNFSSGCSVDNIPEFHKLTSLSESLICLLTDPHWIDLFFVKNKIGLSDDIYGSGSFSLHVKSTIERIIEHFDKPNRNDKIEEILK